jgi:tetratricopeptide (TPR) repeat protein
MGSIDLYIDEKQYEKALEECQKIVDLDPWFYSVYLRYYRIYTEMGEDLKAVEALQKIYSLFPENEKYIPITKEVYNREGLDGVKKWQLELLLKNAVNKTMALARNYATLGDKEKALDYLEMAYKNRTVDLPSQMYDSRFEGLLNEPRFQALLDSMNLTPYQTETVNSTILKK